METNQMSKKKMTNKTKLMHNKAKGKISLGT